MVNLSINVGERKSAKAKLKNAGNQIYSDENEMRPDSVLETFA